MDQWDVEYLKLDGPAFIRIGPRDDGVFHFGAVDGIIDHRLGEKGGQPVVEFSWDGTDEMNPVSGRGWASADGDQLTGRIYVHHGEESGFVANKDGADAARRRRPRHRTA